MAPVYRIDRTRGRPRGYAHHAEEERQSPPGHAERIAAHEARVERDLAAQASRRARLRPIVAPEEAGAVPLTGRLTRRGMLRLRHLLVAILQRLGCCTRPEAAFQLGITGTRLEGVIAYPWFRLAPERGRSMLALTRAGCEEAERLAREGDVHADR